MRNQLRGRSMVAAVWFGVLTIAGCGETEPLATATERRLKALVTTYLDYAAARGAGPANQHQLTRHLQAMPPCSLGLNETSVESLAQLHISPRDQLPFAIRYGQPLCLSGDGAEQVVAQEAIGDHGTRYVAYANGHVQCVESTTTNMAALSSVKGF